MSDLTKDQVFATLEYRRGVLQPLHEQIALDELCIVGAAVYRDPAIMKYLPYFPPGFVASIPSFGADVVHQRLAQIHTGETPAVKVGLPPHHRDTEGGSAKEKDRDEKEALENDLQDFLKAIDTSKSRSPWIPFIQHTDGLGLGVICYQPMKSRLLKHPLKRADGSQREPKAGKAGSKERLAVARWERERQGRIPWDIYAVHPLCAFFDLDHDPIEDMITEEIVSPSIFRDEYPHLEIPMNAPKTATLVKYCSRDCYGAWLDGRAMFVGTESRDGLVPNRSGILWYKLARSPFGFESAKGDWVHSIQGVIRGMRAQIFAMTSDFNTQNVAKLLYLFEQEEFESDDLGAAAVEVARKVRAPGAPAWLHTPQVKQIVAQARNLPEWFFRVGAIAQASAESHSGQRVLSGADQDPTAKGLTTRVGLARGTITGVKQSVEQAASAALTDMVWIQKHEFGQPIVIPTVKGFKELKPEDIPDTASITVDFSPPTAEDRAFELQNLLARKAANAASLRRILEADPDVEDVEEEWAEIMADVYMLDQLQIKSAQQAAQDTFTRRVQDSLPNPAGPQVTNTPVTTAGSPQNGRARLPI